MADKEHPLVKRIVWKEGDLVSFKLREDLYAAAQMIRNSIMRFYAASSVTGDWAGLAPCVSATANAIG
ncbi:hypothetical protein ACWYXO_06295 [Janthinobacterium aestuarii]|uniref:hypothetical protein n=1 Tax=Janthinobacterium lividum TaxID=29581 RepID=UPI00044C4A7D|nr:hypothetical protein [Janthinobacterium lividum]EZP39091.1 hypothetical protein BW37_02569 [Janthinobacterium lividum]